MRVSMPTDRQAGRGRRSNISGMLAEEGVERLYREQGAAVIERRCRIGGGELDSTSSWWTVPVGRRSSGMPAVSTCIEAAER